MYISIQLTPAQARGVYATYRRDHLVETLMRDYGDMDRTQCTALANDAIEIADIENISDATALDNAVMEACWKPRDRDISIIEISNWLIRHGFEFEFIQEGAAYCIHCVIDGAERVVPVNNVKGLNKLWDDLIAYWL